MNRLEKIVGLAVAVAAALSVAAGAATSGSGYHLLHKRQLGGEGGWDYLTLDAASRRLFISRGAHVMVVDAASGDSVGDIPETPGVHGVALAPELGRGFTSNGRSATATIFDLKTLRPLGQVKTGDNPDAILYEPLSNRVFTMNGGSNDSTAIDAASGTVAGSVILGGRPEFAVTDAGKVYVNIEDKSEIVMFDARTLQLEQRWPLAPCAEPTGLALDAAHHRLFAGCRNKMMAVMDSVNGRVVATLPIGQGVDSNRYDPATGFVFASCGEGTLTVAHQDSPDSYRVVDNVVTQRGARTMELDAQSHTVYLVTADYEAAPATTTPAPHTRPNVVPNSFVLLTYGR